VSQFRVSKTGAFFQRGQSNFKFLNYGSGATNVAFRANHIGLSLAVEGNNDANLLGLGGSTNSFHGAFLAQGGSFGWYTFDNVAPDLRLFRDEANTLGQRNGVNAQTFNLYNTYTDASNYERGFMSWSNVANRLVIGTGAAGTGVNRAVQLGAGNGFVNLLAGPGARVDAYADTFVIYNRSGAERLRVDSVGSVRITTALTVDTLPGTPLVGMMARVTDATAPAVGSTVAGGGAANAMCWYNGTNWTVIGV
jgi:hypothetical protein